MIIWQAVVYMVRFNNKMNILILSCGTRNKIVQYFKHELNGSGNVIAADCWELAPALYEADKHFIVPKINDEKYLDIILKICQEENVKGVLSLIDPELSLLSKNRDRFEKIGVSVFVSDYEVVETCFDKGRMFDFCRVHYINTVPTYKSLSEFIGEYTKEKETFPVFVKPIHGSCSVQAQIVTDIKTLELLCEREPEMMIQRLMKGQEYGIDVYTDLISKKVTSVFVKKKLLMRAGETDKAVSVVRRDMFDFVERFVSKLGTIGPIDIDLFEQDGKMYISEVNPRFGGGYPHAYECGINFIKLMLNNMNGIENKPDFGNYKENIYMMKYLDLKLVNDRKQVL